VVVLAAVMAGLTVAAPTLAASLKVGGPRLKVVATNLNNPRKLFLAPSGAIFVVEAGTGGSDKCLGTGPNTYCVGLTGSIMRIANGAQRRVVTGLASWAIPGGQRAQGPAAIIVRGRTYDVLMGDAVSNAHGGNALGPDGSTAGDLIATPPGKAAPRAIARFADFEAAHNPDHGAGPGSKFGDPPIDSNPYALAAYRGGFAVADAGANDLLWISPRGTISVLAVFPTQTEKLTKSIATRLGAPTLTSLSVQSVPSSVTVGPDGALYVGELTGRPFQPGAARIWRVVPGQKLSLYASGFTNITDLAFDGKNLLVLEAAAKGLWADPTFAGALIRVAPDGTRTVLASKGLVAPTGLAVGQGRIYIANYGFFPGTGPGPHGQVVSLPASLGS
jgi:hypothetical protein